LGNHLPCTTALLAAPHDSGATYRVRFYRETAPSVVFDSDTRELKDNLDFAMRPLDELGKHELCPGSTDLIIINEGR